MTLEVRNISKAYGDRNVLKNISFDISKGQIVGLLGKNGVGKTTLLKLMAGLNPLESGNISLEGLTPRNQIPYQKSIGYMSERNPIYYDMYVSEYLFWIASQYKISIPSERVKEVCQELSLLEMTGHKIKELSKGFKQRVGLAAAIMHNPKMLLLDEPVNGLDPSQIIHFRKLVLKLSHDRIIIMSSHLMQEIEAVCHRIILLDNGVIQKDELLKSKDSTDLLKFLLVPNLPLNIQDLLRLNSVVQVEEHSDGKYIISYKPESDPRRDIFESFVAKGMYIKELKDYKEELDQYFT